MLEYGVQTIPAFRRLIRRAFGGTQNKIKRKGMEIREVIIAWPQFRDRLEMMYEHYSTISD
jgi:hypothetical protein